MNEQFYSPGPEQDPMSQVRAAVQEGIRQGLQNPPEGVEAYPIDTEALQLINRVNSSDDPSQETAIDSLRRRIHEKKANEFKEQREARHRRIVLPPSHYRNT